ncbi:MAG TPA: heterodisulfide reductase-related iron-sulfur binding cluster, partial [Acidobacteriaceae bacterium]
MLPLVQKIAFLLFAMVAAVFGSIGFYRLSLRIRRGTPDPEPRRNDGLRRFWYALTTTLTQRRTFRKRPSVSLFHSFIVYGFLFYGLVNLVDGLEGYLPFTIQSNNPASAAYNVCADMLSFLVLVGVIALVIRRFLLPSRHDFDFNSKTLLHEQVRRGTITRDSVIVSAFIVFHVGSRAIGAAARLKLQGEDSLQPFALLLSHLVPRAHVAGFEQFGYWGALGSVLAFFAYFPWSKHMHIFMAPLKYFFRRDANSGELPPADIDLEAESPQIGASKLEDLAWPRLLDAYACIQCNRCQEVCPASATGKSLSPAALEINKRMELNDLGRASGALSFEESPFEKGFPSPRPLLEFAISAEAVWACTTCGACMEVCPVQDEQMLDIVDIRRHQVMIEGKFPSQLQSAFRGMERASNPWGIARDQRFAWAEGLDVKTVEQNPDPDVLFWVGCAASYDPQAQRTARAFVQLLTHANVDFAVLGKREGCTGDSARRAGNEYLYRQLAEENVATLNRVHPKLIVATCPHCLNSLANEYRQLGGNYKVMHHTEYLEQLVAGGRLEASNLPSTITYHDPCYLGRHNGVYEAPRNVLRVLAGEFVEMERGRENSFCCGAGGAQFWKEEESGTERVSDNRFREAKARLGSGPQEKVLAVGCPFCKSMLTSTPEKSEGTPIQVKDVAELLLEGVERKSGEAVALTEAAAAREPQAETASNREVAAAIISGGPTPSSQVPAE